MRAKVVWFILVLWFFLIVFFYMCVDSRAEKITLQWDIVDNVDGYYIYQSIDKWNGQTQQSEHIFDYSDPVKTIVYPDGRIPQDVDTIIIDLPGVEGKDTRYFFTARAYRGDEQSADSNEIDYVVALTIPPAPGDLSGSYNKEAGVIKIGWTQPEEQQSYRQISHWIVYWRLKGNDEWIPIGRINADHALSMEAPFAAVEPDQQAEVEFTIVAYRRSGVFSQNSEILTLNIDRRGVPPIQNLRINIEIPVT